MTEEQEAEGSKRSASGRKIAFAVFLLVITGVALAIGLILNHVLKTSSPETARIQIDCHPDKGATQTRCEERGCTWVDADDSKKPKCTYPEKYGYMMAAEPETTANGVKVMLNRINTPALYGMEPYQNLTVMVEFHTDSRLRIKIFPAAERRFEIPDEALNIPSPAQAANEMTRLYDVTFQSEPVFGVVIKRRATNATIFNTSLPGLAYYPQFLQISTLLPSSYVYGFGEHRHETFLHDMNYRKWAIFTRDLGPDNNWNLYGAHPVYMNVEGDGKANMVFLKNSNAMEVFLQPDPSITFRTIGGVLDFYIFVGDSPGHAVSLYTEAIGRPVLPPYWALGYQLSRWGYANLSDLQMVVDRTRAAGIPYDVQWADIDSFYEKLVFTVDKGQWAGLPQLVSNLKAHHQHFVIIVDPGIGTNQTLIEGARNNSPGYEIFQDGQTADIFVKDHNGSTLIGKVWPGLTAFPDYTKASIVDWFVKYIQFYRNNESVDVDALWIDMNEPASFVPGSVHGCERTKWDFPPYVPDILGAEPEGKMFDKTICMTSQQTWGRHYDVHSLYAHSMAMRTHEALRRVFPGKRPWTMTRSSFAGTGHYATKWTGDNQSKWPAMHWSIISIMEFGMFGFAMNGADICGFWFDTTYHLCIRWHQLGAFYPFARNHNGRGDPPHILRHQDPGSFDQRFIDIVKRPLMTRYRLLPYLYTCLYNAHLNGHTVMRPLLFEFPADMKARSIDRQFLLGPALLLSPVLEPNATMVNAYFPDARWYDYFTGEEVTPVGQTHKLSTPLDKFNLHVRGGHVIPWQTPSLTTYQSRKNPMGLIVSLDREWRARGELYWDDGESEVSDNYTHISFTIEKGGELKIQVTKSSYNVTEPLMFEGVDIYGMTSPPSLVQVDGQPLGQEYVRMDYRVVRLINLKMNIMENHTITWAG